MEGLKELLAKHKETELTEAQFEEELNKILPKNWIPKDKFNELSEKHKALEQQNAEYVKKIEEATKNKTSIEDLNKTIADLKAQHEADNKKKEAEFLEYKKNAYIEKALEKSGAKTIVAVKSLLDLGKVVATDNGEFAGLTEQIDAIKKDEKTAYLFSGSEDDKPSFGGSSSGGSGSHNDKDEQAIRQAMGL